MYLFPVLDGIQLEAHQLVWLAKRHAAKIRLKAFGGGILGRFSKFQIYRPEIADDVITGVAVEQVGMGLRGKVADSALYSGRIIQLLAWLDPFYAISCSI